MDKNEDEKFLFIQSVYKFWMNNNKLFNMLDEDEDDDDDSEDESNISVNYWSPSTSSHVIRLLIRDNKSCIENLKINLNSFRYSVRLLNEKWEGSNHEIDVIILLFWLASGCSYKVVSRIINIPQSSIIEITSNIINRFLNVLTNIIKYPIHDEFSDIRNGFVQRGNSIIFDKTVGAIDCISIGVLNSLSHHSGKNNNKSSSNKKQKNFIHLQVLCDHNGKFLNIYTYTNSIISNHQSVFQNSPLFLNGHYPKKPYFILGSCNYTAILTPIKIVTPYKQDDNLTRAQKLFNKYHKSAKIVVNKSLEILTKRWISIFEDKPIELKLEEAIKVIYVCCELHNICLINDDIFKYIETNNEINNTTIINVNPIPESIKATDTRNDLCKELMAELRSK